MAQWKVTWKAKGLDLKQELFGDYETAEDSAFELMDNAKKMGAEWDKEPKVELEAKEELI